MTDIYKPQSDDRDGSKTTQSGASYAADNTYGADASSGGAGRTLLAGVVGGVLSAAGYLVYSRLPDEQRDKLHGQVRQLVESRVNELRGRFNI